VKYFLILLFLIISYFWTAPAEAKNCQYWRDREICFVQIKRSAKYYWEYRATVTIDGIKQTPTIYNCRTQKESPKKGRSIFFTNNGVGELICSFFEKK
jgi:hypothetical protein